MSDFPIPLYKVGDRVYCHNLADDVTILDIQLTAQRQLRYQYQTDEGSTGLVAESDLGNPPIDLDDVPDLIYINLCTVADLTTSFPHLPGGKGKLARKIIEVRNESPFEDERNFIDRMLEIEPKAEWEQISYKLRYDKEREIGA